MKLKVKEILSLVFIILISLLIILVGFFGIYKKDANKYVNLIPDYKLSSDLKGSKVLELDISDDVDTVYYDKDGNKVDSSELTDENEDKYTKEEVDVNKEENLTIENYKKTLEIFKERLKFLQVDQYRIDLDEETGKMILTFEDDYPEDVESILPMEGRLELVDSNTSDVILDYASIKSAGTNYAQTENGYTVYLEIKLTDEGLNKINDIDKYKTSVEKNDDSEETTETTNKFKIEFDSDEIEEVSYNDYITIGNTLRIILLENSTNTSTVNSKLNTATVVSKLATIGKTPVVYTVSAEEYQKAVLNTDILLGASIAIAVVILMIVIYIVFRFKSKGLLAAITMLANAALFTLLIRLTGITISLNTLAGIVALLIINIYLLLNILKEIENKDKSFGSNIKEAYLKSIDVLAVSLIIFAVFAFNSMTVISSMGLLLFWGWLVVIIGNLLLTVPTLRIGGKE